MFLTYLFTNILFICKADAEEPKTNDSTIEKTDSVEVNTEAKETPDESVDASKANNEDNDSTLKIEEEVQNNPEWYKHKFYSRIFESLCRRRLPFLLPKYKEVSVITIKYVGTSSHYDPLLSTTKKYLKSIYILKDVFDYMNRFKTS